MVWLLFTRVKSIHQLVGSRSVSRPSTCLCSLCATCPPSVNGCVALCGDGLEAEYARVGSSPYFFVKGSPSREKEICHIRQTRVHGTTARGDEVLFDLAFTWIDPVQSLVDAHRVSFVVRLFLVSVYVVTLCPCCVSLALTHSITTLHHIDHQEHHHHPISTLPVGKFFLFLSLPPPSVSFVRESLSEGQTYLYKMCSAYSV